MNTHPELEVGDLPIPPPSRRQRISDLLGVDPESKPGVYLFVHESADYASLNYWLELFMSAGIATLGLVLNSPAVVIGAMLISPLMGPILGAGLSLAAADLYLGLRSLINLALSLTAAVLFSAILVWVLPFHLPTSEILARTQPNLLDLGVALFSGLAGSLVVVRGGKGGGVTALPGVSIAVALMPPLCTVGFGLGSGLGWNIVGGAGLLFFTNLAAIIASAMLVFYLSRMEAPDVRARINEELLAKRGQDRLYSLLQKTRLHDTLNHIGKLRWRILMPLVALTLLAVPLSKALIQVQEETQERAAVRDILRHLTQPGVILTHHLQRGSNRLTLKLVATESIEAEKLRQAERTLSARIGKEAVVTLVRVAGQEDLAQIREELKNLAPGNLPPVQLTPDLSQLGQELPDLLEQSLKKYWPNQSAELSKGELVFAREGLRVRVHYLARKPLEPSLQETLQRALASDLDYPTLKLELILDPAAPPRSKVEGDSPKKPSSRARSRR